jgi:hypothetical protein
MSYKMGLSSNSSTLRSVPAILLSSPSLWTPPPSSASHLSQKFESEIKAMFSLNTDGDPRLSQAQGILATPERGGRRGAASIASIGVLSSNESSLLSCRLSVLLARLARLL